MERIRAVFNWSGGKDSAHALWRAMRSGDYEIVALLTTVDGSTRRSTMHGIPAALLQAQAERIGIPLYRLDLAPNGDMADYGAAMSRAVAHFGARGVTHFIFGDISCTTCARTGSGSSRRSASKSSNRSGENLLRR